MDQVTSTDLRQLEEWLADRGLKKYVPLIVQHEIYSLNDLAMLTAEDMVEMGITAVGARRKLLCHTSQLKMDSRGSAEKSCTCQSLPRPGSRRKLAPMADDDNYAPLQELQSEEANNWAYMVNSSHGGTGLEGIVSLRKGSKGPSPPPSIHSASESLATRDANVDSKAAAEELAALLPPAITVAPTAPTPAPVPAKFSGFGMVLNPELAAVVQSLEGETQVLESITEAAAMLLKYEKEDAITSEGYVPGKISASTALAVDVGFFRNRMQNRIAQFMKDSTPEGSPREMARAWGVDFVARGRKNPKVNYADLINHQTLVHEQLEVVHERYLELLDKCLDSIVEDLNKHASVGEYRDIGEYKLKMQLAQLIGMAEPGSEQAIEDDNINARLGITAATLARRRSTARGLEDIVKAADSQGHGILQTEQIRELCEKDPAFRAKMEVLAFNLALDPENRFVADDDAVNAQVQAELEEIVGRLKTDEDGLVAREAFDQMSPTLRRTLVRYGLPALFPDQ